MNTIIKNLLQLPVALSLLAVASCTTIDDQRIPTYPVEITFTTIGVWDTYGVSGAAQARIFTKSPTIQPQGFPYTATSATGFGGILLASDFNGELHAYDLACPVEIQRNKTIHIDTENNVAQCPTCGSTYDIFRYGGPLSGPALQKGYGLRRYNILRPAPNGAAAIIRP